MSITEESPVTRATPESCTFASCTWPAVMALSGPLRKRMPAVCRSRSVPCTRTPAVIATLPLARSRSLKPNPCAPPVKLRVCPEAPLRTVTWVPVASNASGVPIRWSPPPLRIRCPAVRKPTSVAPPKIAVLSTTIESIGLVISSRPPNPSVERLCPTCSVWPPRTTEPSTFSSPPIKCDPVRMLVVSQTSFRIVSGKKALTFLNDVVSTLQSLFGSLRSPPRVAKVPPTESITGEAMPAFPPIQAWPAKLTPFPVTVTSLNRERPLSIVVSVAVTAVVESVNRLSLVPVATNDESLFVFPWLKRPWKRKTPAVILPVSLPPLNCATVRASTVSFGEVIVSVPWPLVYTPSACRAKPARVRFAGPPFPT